MIHPCPLWHDRKNSRPLLSSFDCLRTLRVLLHGTRHRLLNPAFCVSFRRIVGKLWEGEAPRRL